MQYRILTIKLQTSAVRTVLDSFGPRDYDERYVQPDYDEHDSFGFYEGDARRAYEHACFVIHTALEKKGEPSAADAADLKRDMENYLSCLYTWAETETEQAEYLMTAMVYFGLEEELHQMIQEAYRDYEEEKKDPGLEEPCRVPLNFPKLYKGFGDALLFRRGRYKAALKFYRLAALGWKDDSGRSLPAMLEAARFGNLVAGKRGNDQEGRMFAYAQAAADVKDRAASGGDKDKASESADDEAFFGHIRECRYRYYKIQDSLQNFEGASLALDDTDRFYEALRRILVLWEQNMKRKDWKRGKISSLREIYFMAYLLREQLLLQTLAQLAGNPGIARQDTYRRAALDCLRATEADGLEILRQYVKEIQERGERQEGDFFDVLLTLAQVAVWSGDIRDCLRIPSAGQRVAYYTSMNTLGYMLPGLKELSAGTGRFAVMHMAYMNDPNEGRTLKRYLLPDDSGLDRTPSGRRDASYPYVFMKCFTPLIDDLPMWEMYGDHAKGCCIVLRPGCFISEEEGVRPPLFRVCYLRKDDAKNPVHAEDNPGLRMIRQLRLRLRKIGETMRKNPAARNWYLRIIDSIAYLFKDADYHHEREIRIFYQYLKANDDFCHTPGDCPKLYIMPRFYPDIEEIILGPKFEGRAERMPYLQEQLEKMCRYTGGRMPWLTTSGIEYR